jgi:predicted nucleic acid-binding Zn ribbon protein
MSFLNRRSNLNSAVIFSIWPMPLREYRPKLMPQKDYHIPPASPDNLQRLVIEPQIEINHRFAGQSPQEEHQDAMELAEDLVRAWTLGKAYLDMNGEAAPGIWIDPRINELTDKQIMGSSNFKDIVKKQDLYFSGIIEEADRLEREKQGHSIGLIHHVAGQYLGVLGRPWQAILKYGAFKECIVCAKPIPKGAMQCSHCQSIVDPEAYANYKRELNAELLKHGISADGSTLSIPSSTKKGQHLEA